MAKSVPSTVKSIPPSSIVDANLPIALRPWVDFPPQRGSVFDDPGDEKSWHISQRSEGLTEFFEGREPSWYASAIAPLKGANRVLDLGCGPGLTLKALLEQGCSSVLGIDRWPAFTANSRPAAPIVAHDLTLPMPFLESGSFDGVISHYALDYVSPIGMRQVLREARRILAPGGRLVIYVAAVGMGSGDVARTAAYSPPALWALLDEAGFDEVEAEATSNGRNSVMKARCPARGLNLDRTGGREARAPIEGDTQLSGSFASGGDTIEFELVGSRCSAVFALDLPPAQSPDGGHVSFCARVQRSGSQGVELQVWVWRGHVPVASHCSHVEFVPTEMRVNGSRDIEHAFPWNPGVVSIEPLGSAYARFGDLSPGDDLSDAQRGAEGRQIIIESIADMPADIGSWFGRARNRFLVRRAAGTDPLTIDREWLAGRAHGIVFPSEDLDGEQGRELLLWAGWRQALVFVDGVAWTPILAAASRREAELRGPVVLVDPALDGASPRPLPLELVAFAEANDRAFVLLTQESRELSTGSDLARLSGQLLHGGPVNADEAALQEANETLRHLTERTLLMRLRQARGHSPAEVGRRKELC